MDQSGGHNRISKFNINVVVPLAPDPSRKNKGKVSKWNGTHWFGSSGRRQPPWHLWNLRSTEGGTFVIPSFRVTSRTFLTKVNSLVQLFPDCAGTLNWTDSWGCHTLLDSSDHNTITIPLNVTEKSSGSKWSQLPSLPPKTAKTSRSLSYPSPNSCSYHSVIPRDRWKSPNW